MTVQVRLLLASALMLFTELLLIRWLGGNVLHLSYFSNIVLLGSFLGIGLGFLLARPQRRQRSFFPALLAGLVVLAPLLPGGVDRAGSDLIYFTAVATSGFPPVLTLFLIFTAVAAVMVGPGLMVAECFHELPRLEAYRLDLIGSLMGTLLFAVLSFLGAPPLVWSLLLAAAVLVLAPRPLALTIGWLLVSVLAMSSSLLTGDIWSPYYRIQVSESLFSSADGTTHPVVGISANGVPHQAIVDLDVMLANPSPASSPYPWCRSVWPGGRSAG